MKAFHFEGELLQGHKGVTAVLVPFDPHELFGKPPVALAGRRHGWLVKGTANRKKFSGYIGERWGRFFVQISDEVRAALGVEVGETLAFALAPTDDADVLALATELSKRTTQPRTARR